MIYVSAYQVPRAIFSQRNRRGVFVSNFFSAGKEERGFALEEVVEFFYKGLKCWEFSKKNTNLFYKTRDSKRK